IKIQRRKLHLCFSLLYLVNYVQIIIHNMYLLFPGRHHILTDFQFKYLFRLIHGDVNKLKDVNNKEISFSEPVEAIVFAVTSANHSGTKRNPVPFYLRAMMLQEF